MPLTLTVALLALACPACRRPPEAPESAIEVDPNIRDARKSLAPPDGGLPPFGGMKGPSIATPEGKAAFSAGGGPGKGLAPKGEIDFGVSVPESTLKRLDLPVYAAAVPEAHTNAETSVTATYKAKDPYDDVKAWYTKELPGWKQTSMEMGGGSACMFASADGKATIAISKVQDTGETLIVLTRQAK